MTAGAKTPLPARSDGLDNVDGSSDAADIMPSARLGKLEMPQLRGLKAETAVRRGRAQSPHLGKTGGTIVKSFIILTVVVLTLGKAIAAIPGAAGSMRTISATQPVVTTADHELPFDRYWSKN